MAGLRIKDARRIALLNTPTENDLTPAPANHILLVGTGGQVGICTLREWLGAGARVTVFSGSPPLAFGHPHLDWQTGAIEKPESFDSLDLLPDTMIFTAPIGLLPPLMHIFAKRGVKRMIAFSSTSIHTRQNSGNKLERKLIQKVGEDELQIRTAAVEKNIAVTLLRPTLIYGVGIDKNISRLSRALRKMPVFPLPLNTNGLRQPVHAEDLAQATVKIIASPCTIGKTYEVGGAEQLTYRAMLDRIAAYIGKQPAYLPVPGFACMVDLASMITGRPYINGEFIRRMGQDMVFNDSAARHDFGWNPRQFLDITRQPPSITFV